MYYINVNANDVWKVGEEAFHSVAKSQYKERPTIYIVVVLECSHKNK